MTHAPSAVWVEASRLRPSRWAAEYYRKEHTDLETFLDGAGQKLAPLGDLGRLFTGPFGSELPASIYNTPNGIPLLRVQNIGELFLNEDDLARIPEAVHQEIYRSRLEPGDLALAKAGRLGALSKIPAHIPECNITQHIVGVKVDGDRIRGSYLAAFFLSRFGSFQLRRQGIGTLIKYLGVEETRAAKVPVPDRRVQDYIGAKVELAEQCWASAHSRDLEVRRRLTRALGVDPWSIPSAADLRAEEYRVLGERPACSFVWPQGISSLLGAHCYEPRHMAVEWKLREAGLRQKSFSEIAVEITNGPDCRAFVEEGTPYIKVANLLPGRVDRDSAQRVGIGTQDVPERQRVRDGNLLITRKGSYGVCAAATQEDESIIISSEIIRVELVQDWLAEYVACFLNTAFGRSKVDRIATGTMMLGISHGNLVDVHIPWVPPEAQQSIAAGVGAWRHALSQAYRLIREAKADVEALIEGTLDTKAILSGKLKPPAEEEVLGA